MTIRVLIVDDHQLIRDTLTDLFAATEDIEAVGQCADGSEVAEAVERTRPDVILMDLRMPRMDGLTATREVLAAHPEVRIIVLTGALTPRTAREAKGAGAVGYLLKADDPDDLPGHIRAVAAGGSAWSPLAAAVSQNDRDLVVVSSTGVPGSYVDEAPPEYR